MMIDQGLSSAANFAFALFALRTLDIDSFGAVSYGLLVYSLLLSIQRNVMSEPFLVRASVTPTGFLAATLAQSAVPMLIGALGIGFQGHVATVALFGMVFPVLAYQDAARYVAFRVGRTWHAIASDAVWLVGVGALWVLPIDVLSARAIVLIWALGAGLGLLAQGVLDRNSVWLSFADGRRCGQLLWARGRSYLTDFAIERGMSHLVFLLTIVFGGFAAMGSFHGARTLLGPLNVAFLALPPMRLTALREVGASAVAVRRLALDSVALACAAAALGALLTTMPARWLQLVVGSNVSEIRQLLPAVTAFTVALAITLGPQLGMKVFATGRQLVLTRSTSVLPSIAIAIPWLAMAADGKHAMAAALSLTIGNLLGGVIWWTRFVRVAGPSSLRTML